MNLKLNSLQGAHQYLDGKHNQPNSYDSVKTMVATEDFPEDPAIPLFTKIYVVGPNSQQNKLLALCLEKELRAECECRKFLPLSAAADKNSEGLFLYLYDCLACNPAEIEKVFDVGAASAAENLMIVLFNVAPDCRIERVVKQNKVRGVFYQNDSCETFLKGIRALLGGELWLTRKVLSDCILSPQPTNPAVVHAAGLLSRREKMILQEVAMGLSNKEIAEKLNISVHTVKTHLYKIFHKIDVPNRLQASLWAVAYLVE